MSIAKWPTKSSADTLSYKIDCSNQEAKRDFYIKKKELQNLGYTYYNLGKYEEAIEAYKQAIRINPDFAEAHYFLGGAYVFSEDRGGALEQYKILKKLDTELANELFSLIGEYQ